MMTSVPIVTDELPPPVRRRLEATVGTVVALVVDGGCSWRKGRWGFRTSFFFTSFFSLLLWNGSAGCGFILGVGDTSPGSQDMSPTDSARTSRIGFMLAPYSMI